MNQKGEHRKRERTVEKKPKKEKWRPKEVLTIAQDHLVMLLFQPLHVQFHRLLQPHTRRRHSWGGRGRHAWLTRAAAGVRGACVLLTRRTGGRECNWRNFHHVEQLLHPLRFHLVRISQVTFKTRQSLTFILTQRAQHQYGLALPLWPWTRGHRSPALTLCFRQRAVDVVVGTGRGGFWRRRERWNEQAILWKRKSKQINEPISEGNNYRADTFTE